MKRTDRLIAAATLALERNRALLDGSSGLSEVRVDILLDADGIPSRAFLHPKMELRLMTKSISSFTFKDA